jgi:carbon monoxide dehydrogenase subunit G
MSKKQKKQVNIDAEVKVGETTVSIDKTPETLNVVVDTKKIDVEVHADTNNKSVKVDTKNLDITVEKTAEGTTINVDAKSKVVKKTGLWIAHMISKKLNKNPKK